MTSTRQHLLHILKINGPQTANELANLLEVTPMAIRQHLQGLENEGFVVFTEEKQPVGRPARRWHLSERAQALFPDGHGKLVAGLLKAASKTFGDEGLEKLLDERTQQMIDYYKARMPSPEAPLSDRVQAFTALRVEDGYMAECHEEENGRWVLIENNCPICTGASTSPRLCSGENRLFRTILGEDVEIQRTEHMLNGDRRCVYAIKTNS